MTTLTDYLVHTSKPLQLWTRGSKSGRAVWEVDGFAVSVPCGGFNGPRELSHIDLLDSLEDFHLAGVKFGPEFTYFGAIHGVPQDVEDVLGYLEESFPVTGVDPGYLKKLLDCWVSPSSFRFDLSVCPVAPTIELMVWNDGPTLDVVTPSITDDPSDCSFKRFDNLLASRVLSEDQWMFPGLAPVF